jgi:hypothetical protein
MIQDKKRVRYSPPQADKIAKGMAQAIPLYWQEKLWR